MSFTRRFVHTEEPTANFICLEESRGTEQLAIALWAERAYTSMDLTRDQARELASALSEWVESGGSA